MNVHKILNNKIVIIVAYVLATLNVIGYISISAYECALVFGAAIFVLNYFTKHVSLQILGALLASNVLFGCGRARKSNEGFDPTELVENTVNTAKNVAEKTAKGLAGKLKNLIGQ
jgi:hypothetical protein